MRDYSDVYQLICLANLETLNSEFIKMGLSQRERLMRLNKIAISQMKSLLANSTVKKLERYAESTGTTHRQRNSPERLR